jgi:hypothetical protein
MTDNHEPYDESKEVSPVIAKSRKAAASEEDDIIWMMNTKNGRRFIWRALEQCGVFRISFSTNALQMAFAEGNRNYGNNLLSMVTSVCPEMYSVMMKENVNVGK